MVVLWSNKSIKSKWVKDEASEGNEKGILFPILIEDVKPPLGFRGMQAARLINWDGSLPNQQFDLLIEAVARIMGRPT